VALRVLDRDPGAARTALDSIRATSRDALAGLRAEVEALRAGADSIGRDDAAIAPRRPRTGLADLPALVERMRATGLPVHLDGLPSTMELDSVVELAAYRIVQEALTNVLRHAGPRASAWITLAHADGRLRITVRDDGEPSRDTVHGTPAGAGHGIAGMRERAASVGGTLVAGPGEAGGFVVTAELPLSREETQR
jgi:signal transduction histidine kinase